MSKILVDLDACLCNTPRMISKWAKEMFDIGPGDVPYSNAVFNIEDAWEGMNFQKMKQIFSKPEFWKSVKPFSMASSFTDQLKLWGEVHIVTDRRWYPELVQETGEWLNVNKIRYDVLATVKGTEKHAYCSRTGITVAVEDRVENVQSISKVCPVVIMRWPYNEEKLEETVSTKFADNYFQAVKEISVLLGKDQDSWVHAQAVQHLRDQ